MLLTNKNQPGFLIPSAQLCQLLVHVSLEIPIWLLRCYVCEVLFERRRKFRSASSEVVAQAIRSDSLVLLSAESHQLRSRLLAIQRHLEGGGQVSVSAHTRL